MFYTGVNFGPQIHVEQLWMSVTGLRGTEQEGTMRGLLNGRHIMVLHTTNIDIQ
jgi:hypothetical protein